MTTQEKLAELEQRLGSHVKYTLDSRGLALTMRAEIPGSSGWNGGKTYWHTNLNEIIDKLYADVVKNNPNW